MATTVKRGKQGNTGQGVQKTHQAVQNEKLEALMANFSMSKPTNVDAQRIITIIENLQSKLSILQYLDSEVMGIVMDQGKRHEKGEIFNSLSTKTVEMLEQEAGYELHLRKIWQENADKTQQQENDATGADIKVIRHLKSHLRNLIRQLEDNPKDFQELQKLKKNTHEDYRHFATYLKALRCLMLKKLSTSAEEKKSHKKQLEELATSISHYEKIKTQRQNDLENLKQHRKKFVNEKDDEYRKLSNQTQEIKNKRETDKTEAKEASKKRQEQKRNFFEVEKKKKEAEVEGARAKFAEMRKANEDKEKLAKNAKSKAESQWQSNVEEYDKNMKEKEEELQALMNEIKKLEKDKAELDLRMAHEEEKAKRELEIEEKIKYQRMLLEEEDSRIHNIIAAVKAAWNEFKASKTKKKKKGGKAKK